MIAGMCIGLLYILLTRVGMGMRRRTVKVSGRTGLPDEVDLLDFWPALLAFVFGLILLNGCPRIHLRVQHLFSQLQLSRFVAPVVGHIMPPVLS